MAHRLKLGQQLATDALGRRVRRQQFGILLLQPLQFAEQLVVLGIRDGRRIKYVIGVVVALDLAAQFPRALGSKRRRGHQEKSRSACAEPAGIP